MADIELTVEIDKGHWKVRHPAENIINNSTGADAIIADLNATSASNLLPGTVHIMNKMIKTTGILTGLKGITFQVYLVEFGPGKASFAVYSWQLGFDDSQTAHQ